MGKVIDLFREGEGNMDTAYAKTVEADSPKINPETLDEDVEKLLNEYDLDSCLPIDPVELAKRFGIEVYKAEFETLKNDTISGLIRVKDNDITIYVNKADSILRQRFTIAHELGHYFMHINKIKNKGINIDMHRKTGYTSLIPDEIDANKFAAALLMPKKIVNEYYKKVNYIGMDKEFIVDWLSSQFKVSKQAMIFRMKNLGIGKQKSCMMKAHNLNN